MNRIVCYFISWNEVDYIKLFHNHYSKFCERIVMYDQYSDDGSVELAKNLGIEVRHFGRPGSLNDQWYLDVKNHCWKECRGKGIDYVIVVDVDEFIMVDPSIKHPFPLPIGYNMISELMPLESVFEINTGTPSEAYSKQALFNPDFVQEINYVHGCHKHRAVLNEIVTPQKPCVFNLFHYRMIGGVDRLIDRHRVYNARMSDFNRKNKMGYHYEHSEAAKREEWAFLKSKALELWV